MQEATDKVRWLLFFIHLVQALSSLGPSLNPEVEQGIQDLQGLWIELGIDHQEIQDRLSKVGL